MSRTIAIFGAGPALGVSVARRFGREGFRVALVSRRADRLAGYVQDLERQGIRATAFTADLADWKAAVGVVADIERALGPIDVLEFSPGPVDAQVVPARDVGVSDLEDPLNLRLRTPVALARAVLPGMVSRGDGALLFAFGVQPRRPDPAIANVGIAQAALLHHVHNLHNAFSADGVYAGALLIDGLITGSEIEQLLRDGAATHLPDGLDQITYPVIEPASLADMYWNMYLKRDAIETLVTGAMPGD